MRHEIHLDVDDWAVFRLAQLREQRETAQLHAVIDEDQRVTDLFIVREDGSIERSPGSGGVVLPNGFVQGGAEDQATWWQCSVCSFKGPYVGETVTKARACLGSCGGVNPNPACTFDSQKAER